MSRSSRCTARSDWTSGCIGRAWGRGEASQRDLKRRANSSPKLLPASPAETAQLVGQLHLLTRQLVLLVRVGEWKLPIDLAHSVGQGALVKKGKASRHCLVGVIQPAVLLEEILQQLDRLRIEALRECFRSGIGAELDECCEDALQAQIAKAARADPFDDLLKVSGA